MDRNPAWFAPKRFGYGAGLPVRWEGWAAVAATLLLVTASARELHGLARPLTCAALIAGFGLLAAFKTEGGWRWRWGRGQDRGED